MRTPHNECFRFAAVEERTWTGVTSGTLQRDSKPEEDIRPRLEVNRHEMEIEFKFNLFRNSGHSFNNYSLEQFNAQYQNSELPCPTRPGAAEAFIADAFSTSSSSLPPWLPIEQQAFSYRPQRRAPARPPARPAQQAGLAEGPARERESDLVTSRVTSRGRPPLFYPASSSSDAVMARCCTILE